MTFERNKPPASLPFEVWKVELRKDCELQQKLFNFDCIGDYALRLLWQDGTDPTIEAIVGNTTTKPKAERPEQGAAGWQQDEA